MANVRVVVISNRLLSTFLSRPLSSNIVSVLGTEYKTDNVTNVTPAIINKVGRNLHNIPQHPINIVKQRVVDHFYKHYTTNTGNAVFSHIDNVSPIVTTEQNYANFDSSMKEFPWSGSSEQFGSPNSNGCPDSNGSSSDSNPRGSERNCLKLRGLPWEATTKEVMEFFGDISRHIQQHGVHMVLDARNRPSGDCYVEMNSVESASKAVERLHRRNMGRRYIEVFQCSGTAVTFGLMNAAGGGVGEGRYSPTSYVFDDNTISNGTLVRARGLAYAMEKEELVDFFDDFNIRDDDVEFLCDYSGRPTGRANIKFPSVQEARRAVQKLNNKYIGSRYVDLSVI